MNVLQAAIIALFYALGSTRWFVGYLGTFTFTPMVLGTAVGIVLGDATRGTLIGATLQTIYLGITFYGGAMPSDTRIATICATAFAIVSNMEMEAAMAIAVPFAALGVALDPVWRTINTSVWGPFVDDAIEKLDLKKIKFGCGWGPFITGFLVSWPIVFVVLYFGQGIVSSTVANMPAWLTQSLSRMGGLLPALGFGMYIRVIGTAKTLPFFILGFYLVKFFNLSIFGIAVLAFILAYTLIYAKQDQGMVTGGDDDDD